jgi:UDP-N-acetylmuramyl pentapeptide phosphotransferase/UDP-N-acetylglucosamine-1-phosphate transferase
MGDATAWIIALLATLVSAGLTSAWIGHARRRKLVDHPEHRRLHEVPTPRGGGIGPVFAILLVLLFAALRSPLAMPDLVVPAIIGLGLAATISALDDHRPLSVRLRLGVHLLAAGVLAAAYLDAQGLAPRLWIVAGALLVAAIVASMNLHNFMDGSDAFLGTQTLFVFAALCAFANATGRIELGDVLFACALAVAAFLPFNWPRAGVFLGDVGSIAFGFLIAAFSLAAIAQDVIGWGGVAILSSGFMIDATATLIGRMRRTRRWLRPHRDHLYQWLRRRGWPATRIVLAYQGWNVGVVVPALVWIVTTRPSAAAEFLLAIVVHALGLVLWIAARRALRRAHRAQ